MNQEAAGGTPEKLYVIKIGGNVIDDEAQFREFLESFAAVPGKKILVHGGGKIATTIGSRLAIESRYTDGRRLTDDATIDLVTMVYGGLINKKIVARLQALDCNAFGLCGADGNSLEARKRPAGTVDYGWAGDLEASRINRGTWTVLLQGGFIPVVASLTHDGEGHILNTNADTIASTLAIALSGLYTVQLIFCFEKDGVLTDIDDPGSVVSMLDAPLYRALKEKKKLVAGILPKIDNAFSARQQGVQEVVIGNSKNLLQLICNEGGTKINGWNR